MIRINGVVNFRMDCSGTCRFATDQELSQLLSPPTSVAEAVALLKCLVREIEFEDVRVGTYAWKAIRRITLEKDGYQLILGRKDNDLLVQLKQLKHNKKAKSTPRMHTKTHEDDE